MRSYGSIESNNAVPRSGKRSLTRVLRISLVAMGLAAVVITLAALSKGPAIHTLISKSQHGSQVLTSLFSVQFEVLTNFYFCSSSRPWMKGRAAPAQLRKQCHLSRPPVQMHSPPLESLIYPRLALKIPAESLSTHARKRSSVALTLGW